MFNWRREFTEDERREIDKAAPSSLLGRMAALLDRLTAGSSTSSLEIDFSRRSHKPFNARDFEE